MTLAEFQPYVERAVTALEWETARARWKQGLLDEREAIEHTIPLVGLYGIEREPLEARLAQIEQELAGDVTADRVPVLPLRSVPMDLIAAAVVRRILRIPVAIPVLSIKALPSECDIDDAVRAIAQRWQHPMGEVAAEQTRVI